MENQHRYYLKRIYKLLSTGEYDIIFTKLRKKRGETNYREWIKLHPGTEILPTIIHECLHCLYPKWAETKVRRYERIIFSQMSQRQLNNLMNHLTTAINLSPSNNHT